MNIYDIHVLDKKGEEIPLSIYKGEVLLIVNTATGCGFTPQYEGLEALYKKFHDDGFEVLDFPCNQFANQAPGTDEEIGAFCKARYDITFPQFHKIDVNGKNAAPLYVYLKDATKGILGSGIKWNFTKFLIDRNGDIAGRFGPQVKPEELEPEIERLLKQQ